MNWIKKAADSLAEVGAASRLRDANALAARESKEADTYAVIAAELARRRNEAESTIHEAWNTIQTQDDTITILSAQIDALHVALVKATGDVAQLTGIDPAVVAGRYKLTVIDSLRAAVDGGALAGHGGRNVQYPGQWGSNASMLDKLASITQQNLLLSNAYKVKNGMSWEEAINYAEARSGLKVYCANNAFYWMDFNARLCDVGDVTANEALHDYQELDNIIIRAINAQSGMVPAGAPLGAGLTGQRADSRHALYKEHGVVADHVMHPAVQEKFSDWTPEERARPTESSWYKRMAGGVASFLKRKFGYDISEPNAVKASPSN